MQMYKESVEIYLTLAGVAAAIGVAALVFILGSRAMAESRSDNDDRDER